MCHRPVGERQGGAASVLHLSAAELIPSPVRYEPDIFGLHCLSCVDDHTLMIFVCLLAECGSQWLISVGEENIRTSATACLEAKVW